MGFNTFPCNPYPISTEELNKGNNDDLNTRVAALESDVSDLNSNKANQITIAPFFSEETAYTAGDLVYYNGLSYRCTNDHEGAWDADDFAATTISNELDSLKSGLTIHNGNGNIKYLLNGDILVLTGTITGGGGTDVAIGTPSNYIGVVSVRDTSTGVMGTYFVLNGALNGWDGEKQTSRTFTNGVEYQVSGNLYKSTT